ASSTLNNLFAVDFVNGNNGTAVGTNKILKTTNGGVSWVNQPVAALSGDLYDVMFINSASGWAVGQNGKIFYTNNGGVGIKLNLNEVPRNFILKQNFPNPFNPVTYLEFGISDAGFVSLKIYDNLGKVKATLVNTSLNPGTYKYDFNASGFTSGIYFYTLKVNSPGDEEEFFETKKMVLSK
ncbi:MAG: T9SS type A sorting domain-containing protein, partial [bacterium]